MNILALRRPARAQSAESSMQALLKGCLDTPGIYGVIVSTVDGNALFSELTRDVSADRIATMNSSLLALAETLAKQALQHGNRFTILENSDGRLVSLRINRTLIMTCISYTDSNLGMILKISQNTAEKLAAVAAAEGFKP